MFWLRLVSQKWGSGLEEEDIEDVNQGSFLGI